VEPIEIEANRRITAWSCLIELRARRKEGNTLVEFEKYKYGYKNNRNKSFELRDIDLEIRRGDIICVVGKSGCGKSTLLKSIADILPEAETNHGVRRHEAFLSGGSIGYLFQHEEWLDWCSVWKNLDTLLRIATDWPAEKRNSKIAESLHFGGLGEQFSDIDDLKNELPKNLSGGQQRRVALGSVLCLDTQLYLLDEPTDKFDFKLKVDVQEELYRRWFLDPDFTCVVVTHDLDEAVFLGDHVICMDDGKIIAAKENKLKGMRSGVRYGRKDFADAVREIESVFYNEWGR
jgi:ABC-type nitrate/sulfonate/bicarbonate transport system ATPase subunit